MLTGRRSWHGALYITLEAPDASAQVANGFLMSPLGVVYCSTLPPQVFLNGYGFRHSGELCIAPGGAIAAYFCGYPVTAEGSLVVQLNVAVHATDPYIAGIRVGPYGGIYCLDTTPPSDYGFSNGFSNGFDIQGGAPPVVFSPIELFEEGEQGCWFDPSDLTTMFQDSAGITPVTADGQTVGLILDKSKGLVLGSELAVNGDFGSGTGWTLSDGFTIGSGTLNINAASGTAINTGGAIAQAGKYYEFSIVVNSISGGSLYFSVGSSSTVISSPGTFTVRRIAIANNYIIVGVNTGTVVAVIDSVSFKLVAGNHASQTTAAARPLYKTDGTYHWLQFDGVDDSLETAAINFTATDKMSVFSGVHKATATSWQQLVELSSNSDNNDGSFGINAPAGDVTSYAVYLNGLTGIPSRMVAGYSAPITNVLAISLDLSAATASEATAIKVNSVDVTGTPGGVAPGGDNFGTYPLYLGSRAGASTRFNGHIYSLIVRGAASSQLEIEQTEAWVNGKTGAY